MQVGLLEDDIAIQELLCLLLQDEGFAITVFVDAEECLRILGVTGVPEVLLHLLIVDFRLHRSISGLEVIRQVRATPYLHGLPIILTTAATYVDTDELQRLHVTLVEKPFDVDQIVEIIKNLTQSCPQQTC